MFTTVGTDPGFGLDLFSFDSGFFVFLGGRSCCDSSHSFGSGGFEDVTCGCGCRLLSSRRLEHRQSVAKNPLVVWQVSKRKSYAKWLLLNTGI